MRYELKKVVRYTGIYGFKRALIKSFGRIRWNFVFSVFLLPTSIFKEKRVGVIGCGQFAFTTIAYFVNGNSPFKISKVFDPESKNAKTFASFYGCDWVDEAKKVFSSEVDLVYIASNHESHSKYALMAIEKGVDVYIEKPVSVTKEQLYALEMAYSKGASKIFCGYNRPFSPAIKKVKEDIDNISPLMVSIFVIGHFIGEDHWYRKPGEGTRVCGNLGHWIDLCIHLINKTDICKFSVSITYSDEGTPDDNLVVMLKTPRGDLFSITLTSYSEPFEGISETINIHQNGYQVLIDDFRTACFQKDDQRKEIKYRPKDVGHKNAILQPFSNDCARNFDEIILSTKLMLYIKDMVQKTTKEGDFRW